MNNRLKAALVAGVASNVIWACAGAAWAADQDGHGGAGPAVNEIIVTAQRRDESIQKVPMTLQALTGPALSQLNVTSVSDLLKYTPNVTFGNNGPGQGEIFMRGLSAGFRGNQSSGTIANFPNVALYLDEQSMQFPARNADIYMADMQRVEVLEGPQGTLFGGGAEAGAVRYITSKPRLDAFEAKAEASYGWTDGGSPNASGQFTLNVPLIRDRLAVRAVIYDDRQGGYIDNVPSTFTRSNQDLGNYYFNIAPVNGLCPNHLPPGPAGCTIPNAGQYNNYSTARKNFNPATYTGGRAEALYQVNDDWNVLLSESMQDLDAEGLSVQYPVGSDFQPLKPLQITSFVPSYNKDKFYNTAWTVNGKLGRLKAIYTGGYTVRHISQQMDYTNYARSGGGMYYECVGGSTGWGTGAPSCYSPLVYWQDTIRSTHMSHEFRLTTPDDWRLRAIVGAYWERFRIYDVMNFHYKTIPSCTPDNLSGALAGGPVCVANVRTAPGSTANDPGIRDDNTGFGEDTQRGYDQTAIFGSVDYDIIPNVLTLTAGTRWYRYNEFEVGSQYGTGTSCLNVPNGQCAGGMVNIDAANDHVVYSGFKSRAGLTWHVDADTMAYFLFSQGFRPGGYNRSVKQVIAGPGGKQYQTPNGYAPDSLTNYEVGLKTQLLDHRVQLNLSAYWMQWQNVQFLLFNPTLNIQTTVGVNGPDYDIKGAEAQIVARVTDGLTVQGSASYNRSRQANSPCLVDNVEGTPAFGQCITQAILKGSTALQPFANPFGVKGSVAAFAPEFQGNLRARYEWMAGDYLAHVMVGGSYTSSSWNQPATYLSGDGVTVPGTTFLRYKQPAYGTIEASVGVSRDNWYVELYGQNLANSHVSVFTSSAQFIKSEVPLRPCTVAVKIGASF
jgi:outer membrane receptor protein involved in Fe transport